MATAAVDRSSSRQKSSLFTPDPYHVPGYGGYCAQFKYQIGETFGKTTSRLITDKDVASSGRLVLTKIQAPQKPHVNDKTDPGSEELISLIDNRTQSYGTQKLKSTMVPGYTGFIPKGQHPIGKRYAQHCVHAIADYISAQDEHKEYSSNLKSEAFAKGARVLKGDGAGGSYRPLELVPQQANKPFNFISKTTPHHTMSPYYMVNDNADKRFMSGYTGFVPRAREMIGLGYPEITHMAINDFTDDLKKNKRLQNQPIQINRPKMAAEGCAVIYPKQSGLVPNYTGHIPGEKFRYGETFGHSTCGAREKRQREVTGAQEVSKMGSPLLK